MHTKHVNTHMYTYIFYRTSAGTEVQPDGRSVGSGPADKQAGGQEIRIDGKGYF